MRSDAGAVPVRWQEVREGRDEWERVESEVIEEALITIFVNGQELASILCTPRDQDVLALGLLRTEGVISSMDEVEHVDLGRDGCCVDVWLNHGFTKPERRILTSAGAAGSPSRPPLWGSARSTPTCTSTPAPSSLCLRGSTRPIASTPGPGACTRPPSPMGRSSWARPKISAVTTRLIDCRASA